MKCDTPSDLRFCITYLTRAVRYRQDRRLKASGASRCGGLLATATIAIGIGLCVPAHAVAPTLAKGVWKEITPKAYAKSQLSNKEYKCLLTLYTKESNWRVNAYNPSGAYGIPQMKNVRLKYMNGIDQVRWGIRYIYDRYGSMCLALHHFNTKGWH